MKRAGIFGLLFASIALVFSACESELIRKQQEEIRQQQAAIKQLRQSIDEELAARQRAEQKRQACNLAFRSFERAQATKAPRDAVALYRDGLKLCPDDDVAHYELGKILSGMGRTEEARDEFEAALKINPNFHGAKQEMEKIQAR